MSVSVAPARPEALRSIIDRVESLGRNRIAPQVVLWVLIARYALLLSTLVLRRQNEFRSFDYDMGIYDQGIYLVGHGRQFLTVRGLPYFGHHWNPATLLFVPLYWLGAGPNLLNVSQAVAVSIAAAPVFYATRRLTRSGWIALIVACAFLAHPSTAFLVQELFHPDTMAIPFVLAAWCFAEQERWRWFAAAAIAALLWKEDVALAVALLGLAVVWRKHRRYGIATFVGSLAYFVVATNLIIPHVLGRAAFYADFFGPLGSSMTGIARTAAHHPMTVYRVLRDHQAETYAHAILRPFAYVSLLSPTSLLVGLPQYLINMLSALPFIWDRRFHYIAMPLVAATIGMGRAIAGRATRFRRWGLAAVIVVASVGVRNSGILPWSKEYDTGYYWPERHVETTPAYRRAIAIVPKDNRVVTSSPYFFTPHLTHRFEAYTFPNPWRPTLWGINNEHPRDARRVDIVVMDESTLGAQDRELYDAFVARGGEFVEVFREGTVVVWKRVANRARPLPRGVELPPAIPK